MVTRLTLCTRTSRWATSSWSTRMTRSQSPSLSEISARHNRENRWCEATYTVRDEIHAICVPKPDARSLNDVVDNTLRGGGCSRQQLLLIVENTCVRILYPSLSGRAGNDYYLSLHIVDECLSCFAIGVHEEREARSLYLVVPTKVIPPPTHAPLFWEEPKKATTHELDCRVRATHLLSTIQFNVLHSNHLAAHFSLLKMSTPLNLLRTPRPLPGDESAGRSFHFVIVRC